jgi:hypothetical protein
MSLKPGCCRLSISDSSEVGRLEIDISFTSHYPSHRTWKKRKISAILR